MSDTCIVCLGDLSSAGGEVAAPLISPAKSPITDIDADAAVAIDTPVAEDAANAANSHNAVADELISHLQPCGHYLHNECLTPWVERANSCPICRASFHLVELMHKVDGDIISSYPVEHRTQVADLDPSMFLEVPDEEDDDQPCQACGEDDNEDVLMYCDGCQKLWHTYCVGLQNVPYGHWFCENCRAQRELDPRQVARSGRSNRRRTRGQQRRQRGPDSSWNQVWQTVWSHINLDLDFPYDDDESSASYLRRHRQRNQANRQAHDAWLRRMQVAELHGAGNRFRDTEPALPSSPGGESTPRVRRTRYSPLPQVESADEIMAWHAFDQARASSNEPSSTNRKRKRQSATSSPAEPDSEPSSAIKRRRPSTTVRAASESRTPRITNVRRRQPPRIASPIPRRQPVSDSTTPSFLQSLLQEVEDSGSAGNGMSNHRPSPRPAASPTADQNSPRPSSPALSPLLSNHSSPRASSATPPPMPGALRPVSPGLSSTIQPIWSSPEYSPPRSKSPETKETISNTIRPNGSRALSHSASTSTPIAQPRPRSRIPRILENGHNPAGTSRSAETSPTRREGIVATHPPAKDALPAKPVLSLTAKEDVQKLVSSALKPHYHDQSITKEEYTAINRDVSRMLYDKVGDLNVLDMDDRTKWEKFAGDEVAKAVNALESSKVTCEQASPA